ncbi:MAG: GNAT family N-acetyltransferase [Clostridiales bacterium]|jgi:diamine N-acetyltransferase|nr:GNAT family N-acetyltransferase [Clostridiales bacterium]
MAELREIDWDNWIQVVNLEVHEEQKGLVADNVRSLAQAYVSQLDTKRYPPITFAICSGDVVVGFVLMYYNVDNKYDDGTFDLPYYAISRFMIGKDCQGKGLGKQAMEKILEHIRTFPHGKAVAVYLSYVPENDFARGFYKSIGFTETGQIVYDEVVAKLVL